MTKTASRREMPARCMLPTQPEHTAWVKSLAVGQQVAIVDSGNTLQLDFVKAIFKPPHQLVKSGGAPLVGYFVETKRGLFAATGRHWDARIFLVPATAAVLLEVARQDAGSILARRIDMSRWTPGEILDLVELATEIDARHGSRFARFPGELPRCVRDLELAQEAIDFELYGAPIGATYADALVGVRGVKSARLESSSPSPSLVNVYVSGGHPAAIRQRMERVKPAGSTEWALCHAP